MRHYSLEKCALCGAPAEMYYRMQRDERRYFAMCHGIMRHRTEEHTSARAAAREWRAKMRAARECATEGSGE